MSPDGFHLVADAVCQNGFMESHALAFSLNHLHLNEMNQWAVGGVHRDPLRAKVFFPRYNWTKQICHL